MKNRHIVIRPLVVAILLLAASFLCGHATYAQNCVPPPAGLVSWWPGDGDANDIVGPHHGTLQNGATFAAGKVGQAFSFDGVDDYVSVPDHSDWTFGDDPFTIDLWANFDTVPNRAPLVDHNEGAGGTKKWIFWYDDSGHRSPGGPALRFHINSSTLGALDPAVALWNPNIGQWYHIAITRSGSSYSLYLDGVLVITEVDANTIPDANVSLFIGQSELQYFFDGLIDEVEIFNRALAASEIQAIYDAGSAGKCKTNDSDADGVLDDDDLCPGTVIPEAVPTVSLKSNRWALIDDDFDFDTVKKGKGNNRSFTTEDTGGCSCEQIIEEQGLGNGHTKHGCSNGAMDNWVTLVSSGSKSSAGPNAAEVAAKAPSEYVLESNYPNPFNPETRIRFGLPESAHVKLVVYDVLGREVRMLIDGVYEAGTHEAIFEASGLPSGMYLYRLDTPQGSFVQTMQLVK